MNTNHHKITRAGIAALVAGAVLVAAPVAVGADSRQRFDICPAIDSEPLCDILGAPEQSGGGGPHVATGSMPGSSGEWTGEAKDHPGYGPVHPADSTIESDQDTNPSCAEPRWPRPIPCPSTVCPV